MIKKEKQFIQPISSRPAGDHSVDGGITHLPIHRQPPVQAKTDNNESYRSPTLAMRAALRSNEPVIQGFFGRFFDNFS